MRTEPEAISREIARAELNTDLVVVGGGLAGVCCAITAARAGIRVVLVQDRPVLGGNASSEVRLWVVGSAARMRSNNRWAREGGVVNEILVENVYRNPDGNPVIFDTILLEKVREEPNITLLLNTAADAVVKAGQDRIVAARAYCRQDETAYEVSAPLFCDASGDGTVGYLAGAVYRAGAESMAEFGERLAPDPVEYGELLGHSIFFVSKDAGHPVRYIPPSYALRDIAAIPRYGDFNARDSGGQYWWIEYGGRLDTVHDTEAIKWELWKVVYGVWDHIKNSGRFPEAENLTLEWVGTVPGKREGRRFEGDYLLTQQDIVEQRAHADDVSHGGWPIDLHPAEGIYSPKPGCTHWYARGVYGIPYRCLYSRNIRNLFLAGRIISATHVAFGSTRVMGPCAAVGQAVGMAAAICRRDGLLPAELVETNRMRMLQRELIRAGQCIPGVALHDPEDLVRRAAITASSCFRLRELPPNGPVVPLSQSWAQMLPLAAGRVPRMAVWVDVARSTALCVELRTSDRADNYTPDVVLDRREISLGAGTCQRVDLDWGGSVAEARYVFLCLLQNPDVSVRCAEQRVTGLLSVRHIRTQAPGADIGVETLEFWPPERRPGGHNLAVAVEPALDAWRPENVINGWQRPTNAPNAWAADLCDPLPALTVTWDAPQSIGRIVLAFDTDWDHPMETIGLPHPESVMPFCVRHYRLRDDGGQIIAECMDNHQTRKEIALATPVHLTRLTVELLEGHGLIPAALFELRCYER
ncbi:MAG: FAD-dependent oxidoreductase [Chloroflexi bacterium]|nr:FAD-dependent oxidoreductase [Chloroflexota bacterium]